MHIVQTYQHANTVFKFDISRITTVNQTEPSFQNSKQMVFQKKPERFNITFVGYQLHCYGPHDWSKQSN